MDESLAQVPNNASLGIKHSQSLRRRLLFLLGVTLIVALSGVGAAIFTFISRSEAALWAERQKEAAGQATSTYSETR